MINTYEYEKIISTCDSANFSKASLESLFDGLGFVNDTGDSSYTAAKRKDIFVKNNQLVTWLNYEPMGTTLYTTDVEQQKCIDILTYDFQKYYEYINTLLATSNHSGNTNMTKNHIRNFLIFSFLNRINYYLLFVQSKIKSLTAYLTDYFTSKSFSLNSCPIYPTTIQQTLTLSQRDAIAEKTQQVMLDFLRNAITEASIGIVAPNPPGIDPVPTQLKNVTMQDVGEKFADVLKIEDTSTTPPTYPYANIFKRKYYDIVSTIIDTATSSEDVDNFSQTIYIDDFIKYIMPSSSKDTDIQTDFYLQLIGSSSQLTTSIFKNIAPEQGICDYYIEGDSSLKSINNYNKSIISIGDVLFFLSIFIDKLSHIKQFNIKWKHLKNDVQLEFHAVTTLTLDFTEDDESDEESDVNHASYITSVISPILKRMLVIEDDNETVVEDDSTHFNTNVLLVNNYENDTDFVETNLFDNLIYDNETLENVGTIEDTILPTIGQFFNTNGIFGAQNFITRKNNFTLTLEDVQKKFNLYSGQIITRKDILKAIDYIFNAWTTSMSTYTLQIVTCHSNCHRNFAAIISSLTGGLNVKKTVSGTACLQRGLCGCGTTLNNTIRISRPTILPERYTANYDIPVGNYLWSDTFTVTVASGSGNSNSRPANLRGIFSIGTYSSTKYCGPNGKLTFTVPAAYSACLREQYTATVQISDVDSACGVTTEDYNKNWTYQKSYRFTGTYTVTGTLKE